MTTNPTPTSTCVGYAMYIELEKGSSTTQVLIMPEGVSSAHRETHLAVYRRRLTTITPRKTWRHAQSAHRYAALKAADPMMTQEQVVAKVTDFVASYLISLSENGWKVRNQVITVEVTAEDLEDARMAKTPYKVFGRVWKARKKLGFPKEFIVVPEPSPAF